MFERRCQEYLLPWLHIPLQWLYSQAVPLKWQDGYHQVQTSIPPAQEPGEREPYFSGSGDVLARQLLSHPKKQGFR